jgi:hypothetical protein
MIGLTAVRFWPYLLASWLRRMTSRASGHTAEKQFSHAHDAAAGIPYLL